MFRFPRKAVIAVSALGLVALTTAGLVARVSEDDETGATVVVGTAP